MEFMNLPDDILRLIAEKSIKRYIGKQSDCISLYSQIYDSNAFFKNIGYKRVILYEPADDLYGIYLWSLNNNNSYLDPW